MRKWLIGFGLAAVSVIPALAFAQEVTPAVELEPWVCPEGFEGQTLSVYNWSTYVAEDTISNFEAACGVTVNYDVYGSNEDMLARLRQGNPGYDITVPTDNTVEIMIGEDLLEPIDHANVPNLIHVTETLLDQPFDVGNVYSMPYQWGTLGLGYNVELVGAIESWDDVWNYDGPVAWQEDPRAMIGVALNNLGYDVNTSNPDEIAEARDYLIANGSNVVAFAADDGQTLLSRGDVDIAVEYNGDIFQIIADCECDDFGYAVPAEGAVFWMDNLVIPAGAPNHALAEVFIDYILDPQVGADISNYTAFGSPNQTAIDLGLIDEELLNNPGIYPPPEIMENLFSIVAVPEAEVEYSYAWDEIRVALGG